MNASYATVILFEMAHLWAQVQNLPGNQVAKSSEKDRFDRMAREFPAMAQAAKLLQAAGFDFVNGMGSTTGFDALSGDPQVVADTLARLLRLSAPGIVANGERIAAEQLAERLEAGAQACRDGKSWWDNPHPPGSAEAYQWDAGHTRARTQKEA